MKKCLSVLLIAVVLCFVFGCGDTSNVKKRTGSNTPSVNDVLKAGMEAEDKKASSDTGEEIFYDKETGTVPGMQSGLTEGAPVPNNPGIAKEALSTEEGIDVDLTQLSATMVYSEVYNMMVYPENYVGKVVKMNGMFNYLYDEVNDVYYFSCIIMDATACCAQGIEFITTDEFKFPDDYPQIDGDITVVGVFDTYWEGNYIYATLRNARIL